MPAISDDDLIGYVLGDAPTETVSAIQAEVATNTELAASIELLNRCGGQAVPTAPTIAAPRRRPIGWRRLILVLAATLSVGGLSWAGWALLAEKPLLEDHFESNWGDSRNWRTPRRSVFVENGHLRLFDRGYLVTAEEFPGPIDLSFRWRWTDMVGDFLYRDELSIALRTEGVPRSARWYEVTDGIIVKLNATVGNVSICSAGDDHLQHAVMPKGSLPLPAEEWHNVRITDDGETVAVYVSGGALGPNGGKTPAATARIPGTFPHYRVAFYNRERLAEGSHESWIDDIVLRRLQGAGR